MGYKTMTNEEMILNTLTKSGWIVTDQKDDNGATVVVADDNNNERIY